jgi:hypothetical protein
VLSTNTVAGVRCFDDLIAYQRAVELRDLVYAMTDGRLRHAIVVFGIKLEMQPLLRPQPGRRVREIFSTGLRALRDHCARIDHGNPEPPAPRIAAALFLTIATRRRLEALAPRRGATAGLIRYLKSCDPDQFR